MLLNWNIVSLDWIIKYATPILYLGTLFKQHFALTHIIVWWLVLLWLRLLKSSLMTDLCKYIFLSKVNLMKYSIFILEKLNYDTATPLSFLWEISISATVPSSYSCCPRVDLANDFHFDSFQLSVYNFSLGGLMFPHSVSF